MKLRITHQTSYAYQQLAERSVQYIRMIPMTLSHQRILDWSVQLPKPAYQQPDGFGNAWLTLNLEQPHSHLLIQATGTIAINVTTAYVEDNPNVPYLLYTSASTLTQCDDSMWQFAAPYLTKLPSTGESLTALEAFARALLNRMAYTRYVTHVGTAASEAFELGAGVCQDHTHVFLACVRKAGLAARYVSGYIYDASANHMASHAWAEVWLDKHWYCFDVSNQLFTPGCHVYVAVGRDYLDAAPLRGIRVGGGYENLHSQVMVTASD